MRAGHLLDLIAVGHVGAGRESARVAVGAEEVQQPSRPLARLCECVRKSKVRVGMIRGVVEVAYP